MASARVNSIIADINSQETDLNNVLVLIRDLRAQIADGATPAELDAILVELEQNKAKLSEALSVNVPAEEPPPVEEQPPIA